MVGEEYTERRKRIRGGNIYRSWLNPKGRADKQ